MIDIKEAFTRGELVLGVNPLQTPYGQKHPNGGTPGKEYVRLETELWVIDSDLKNIENINRFLLRFVLSSRMPGRLNKPMRAYIHKSHEVTACRRLLLTVIDYV